MASSKRAVALEMSHILVMEPLGLPRLEDIQSADLPLVGNVQLSTADITPMPYVGDVDLIGELDSSNVNVQEWPSKGFLVRGSVSGHAGGGSR